MPLPPIDALRCFVEAAAASNFATAAKTVHLTPSAVGQRIKQLETLVGEPLFQRSRRGVSLTLRGEALLPLATAAVEAAFLVVEESAPASFAGELVIGTRHELGMSWLLPLVADLLPVHPRLNIHLHFAAGSDLLLRVRTGEIACAVSSARLTDPKLDAFNLHKERYVFVASPSLLKREPLRHMHDVQNHRLYDIATDLPLFRYWRDAAGGIDSLNFAALSYFGTIAAIREMVLLGHGVAVLPEYFVREDVTRKRLTKVLTSIRPRDDQFRLVFRKLDSRRALFQWLCDEMRKRPLG